MDDETLPHRTARLRAEILELNSAIRQLHRAGLDNATAQLLLWRKCAELETLMDRCRSTGNDRKVDHIR
jgi:hypothetical protein